jgi:hypothetical protein
MPAWIAGIQVRRMGPETSMSIWIPALHAGTTQSGVLLELTGPSTPIFKKKRGTNRLTTGSR